MFKPCEKFKMLEISTDFKSRERKGKNNSMGGIIIHYIKILTLEYEINIKHQ